MDCLQQIEIFKQYLHAQHSVPPGSPTQGSPGTVAHPLSTIYILLSSPMAVVDSGEALVNNDEMSAHGARPNRGTDFSRLNIISSLLLTVLWTTVTRRGK